MGLGRTLKRKLRYIEKSITLNPGLNTTSENFFRANDLYDPNASIGGHQPIGFDQIMQFYDHFVVIGCKLTAYFKNNDTAYAQFVYIRCTDNLTGDTDFEKLAENGRMRYKLMAQSGATPTVTKLTYKVNPNRFLNRPNPMSDPELKGSASASPTEQCALVVGCVGQDESVNPGTVTVTVVLDYTAVFFEPKILTQS